MAEEKENKLVSLINSLMDVKRYALELFLGGVPKEVKKHIQTARKERLLALRALVDSAITHLEEEEKEAERKKPEKVKIE
jgi:hypothetical protein